MGILDIDIDKMHYMIVASFASIFRDHFHLSKKKIQNYRHGDIVRWYFVLLLQKYLIQKYVIQKYVIQKYDYKTFFSIPD